MVHQAVDCRAGALWQGSCHQHVWSWAPNGINHCGVKGLSTLSQHARAGTLRSLECCWSTALTSSFRAIMDGVLS